jgi:hypothetical protein
MALRFNDGGEEDSYGMARGPEEHPRQQWQGIREETYNNAQRAVFDVLQTGGHQTNRCGGEVLPKLRPWRDISEE